jgi:acetylserotonin N-methyltransferase
MPATAPPPVDDRPIWDLWLSMHYFPAITAADEIGLFACLGDGAQGLEELAAKINADPRALRIHLGLLAALGMVEKRMGLYRATQVARSYLHPKSPYYWGAVLQSHSESLPAHDQLLDMLRLKKKSQTGASVEAWEAGELTLERARSIARFMHAHSLAAATAAARTAVFDGVTRLLDVGGGSGVFAIAAARSRPRMHATVLDIAAMCVAAEEYVAKAGVKNVDSIAVDMFRDPWPDGYDGLFFSNIYHDWSEETCAELSAKAFAALPSGGRIVLHEQLMSDNYDGPATTASFSMLMLLRTRGRQYSLPELTAILDAAGFTDVQSMPSGGYYSLVSAVKP